MSNPACGFSAEPGKDRRYDAAYHPGVEPKKDCPQGGVFVLHTQFGSLASVFLKGLRHGLDHDIRISSPTMTRATLPVGEMVKLEL